ncbi:hypothetical protein [Domibacillus tundrae]|uniref:hypothetical protein n=1 Tax=Domibacillus tundrae TaxID=1587527 RepID=UPI000696DD35|nr:hypothetical protein [Domibacillus tundrae]
MGNENIMDLTQWNNFWHMFRLPIMVSLLGALIGHYAKNGVIQLPIFLIPYSKSNWVKNNSAKMWKWASIIISPVLVVIDFLGFLIGIRFDENQADKRIYVELGFFGDILIGIGTGILAKTAIELTDTKNIYAEISTAFIAGFLGLSYIKDRQHKDLGIHGPDDMENNLDPSKSANLTKHLNETEKEPTSPETKQND